MLGDAKVIEVNDIVGRHGLYYGTNKYGARIVKMRQLTRHLKREISGNSSTTILVGHLAADLDLRYDICVVTRAKLSRLVKAFHDRGYKDEKARENIFAEALDYCGVEVAQKSDEMYEVESARDKSTVMLYIKNRIEGRRVRKPQQKQISMMPELLSRIKAGRIRL